MPSPRSSADRRFGVTRVLRSRTIVLGLTVVAVAAMSAVAVAAIATLATGKASVKGKSETVVVNSSGATLYTLSGESAGKPLKCVSSLCLKFWPAYKTTKNASLTKAPGVSGTIGRLHRIKGNFYQVTLNGRPLYTFSLDKGKKGSAKGEGVTAFGGTWHVVSP